MKIKYKVWDTKNKCIYKPTFEAHRGELEELLLCSRGRLHMRTIDSLIDESRFPDRFKILMFTGFEDKSEHKIYDGDYDKYGRTVKWIDGCFWLVNRAGEKLYLLYGVVDEIEMVGNVHMI